MSSELEEFLDAYSPPVQELARLTRALVLQVIPQAVEQVDPPSTIIAYGLGRRYADLICAIAPYKTYLNLIFSNGARLPDPEGLLAGVGKRARHVKITSSEDLQVPALRALILAALALHGEIP